jgi:hypothetical protein
MPDVNFIANPQQQSPFQTIGNIIGIANAATELQRNRATMQDYIQRVRAERETAETGAVRAATEVESVIQKNKERKNLIDLFTSDPDLKPQDDGTINLSASNLEKIQNVAGQTFPEVMLRLAHGNEGITNARKAVVGLGAENAKVVGQTVFALRGKSAQERIDAMAALERQYGPSIAPFVNQYVSRVRQLAGTLPAEASSDDFSAKAAPFDDFITTRWMPVIEQQTKGTPTVLEITTGAEKAGVNIKPGVPGAGELIYHVRNELPPTTPVYNPATQGMEYRGGGVAAAPPLNTQASLEGMNEHWNKEVLPAAATAPQDIGVLKNIKTYAKGAVTGVETDRRAYIEGIAGLLGMDKAQIAKTSTDMLIKNSTMLAQQGGNTDAMRALAAAMNPNTHMTPQAIAHAANQVIAQRKMALVRQQVLLGHRNTNDATGYQAKLTALNAAADPRALQSTEEIREMADAIKNPQERTAFIRDIQAKKRALKALGVSNE